MLAGFGAISLSILFFFFIYRFDGFGDAVSKVTGILMPFIYGAVIAYLLKPVCNTIEGFLHRIFPEKLHSMANMLAIAATLLFGVLVVYALVMMVMPQLITSVTSLYYTAQTSITRFMRWVNTQEVFLDNETLMGYFNNAYDAIADNLTALRTTLLPSLQNIQGILSGVGVGVMNVVTWFKNLLIGLIVAVYLLASRKKFAKQAKMILYSVVKPHWRSSSRRKSSTLTRCSAASSTARSWTPPSLVCSAISPASSSSSRAHCWCRSSSASPTSSPSSAPSSVPCLQRCSSSSRAPSRPSGSCSSFWSSSSWTAMSSARRSWATPPAFRASGVLFSILLFGGLWGFVGMIVGVPLFAVIYDVIKKLVFHGLRRNGQLDQMTVYHDEFGDPGDPAPAPVEDEETEIVIDSGERIK